MREVVALPAQEDRLHGPGPSRSAGVPIPVLCAAAMLAELFALATAGWLVLRLGRLLTGHPLSGGGEAVVLPVTIFGLAAVLSGSQTWSALSCPTGRAWRGAVVCAATLLPLQANAALSESRTSVEGGWLLAIAIVLIGLSAPLRMASAAVAAALLRRGLVTGRPVVVAGDADALGSVSPQALLRRHGLWEVSRVVVRDTAGERPGPLAEVARLGRTTLASEILLVMSFTDAERLGTAAGGLASSVLPVRLLATPPVPASAWHDTGPRGTAGSIVELRRPAIPPPAQHAKRALDIGLSLLALLALSPLMVLVSLAIKAETPGPVIFRQRRHGFDQRPFLILKFRTMTVLEDGGEVVQARRGDRRVTRVGRMLRRNSIDELPQLLNVLRGEMSLVGPRPHALIHDIQYRALVQGYDRRFDVKPGITGWAQVSGCRGPTDEPQDMGRRVEHDLWYIKNFSLLLDLKILLRTVFELAGHDAF